MIRVSIFILQVCVSFMKPLMRWTIGNSTPLGMQVLAHSVRSATRLYGDVFDFVICHNFLAPGDYDLIASLGVPLHEQHQSQMPLQVVSPKEVGSRQGSGWKLCPPRLRPEAHELWLDNDIVICRRLDDIDHWLQSDATIVSEGLGRLFGRYAPLIPDHMRLCAGFFGVPPGYDLSALMSALATFQPLVEWDEQGLTCACLVAHPHCIVTQQVVICETKSADAPALHFVGVNRAERHPGWSHYRSRLVKWL